MKKYKSYKENKKFSLVWNPVFAMILFLSAAYTVNAQESEDVENTTVNKSQSLPVKKTIEGQVRDAQTQKPVSAARITIPGKGISAISDENGNFTVSIVSEEDVLYVEAYDYNNTEVPVQGKDKVVIDLYPDFFSSYFKEIANPAGKPVDNSSTTASIKSVENLSQINDITADDILQAAFGGDVRSISHSGIAGIGNAVFIRGINSLNGRTQPLYVIDGVMWNNNEDIESIHKGFLYNPLEDIDVNDIESITVLKDGTSIYGSKASNGVILINTKRAESMVTKISLNAYAGIVSTPKTLPVMDPESFRIYASDMLKTIPETQRLAMDKSFMGDPSIPANNRYYNNTDWSDEVYETGVTQGYLINVDGGDEKAMYYFSLGYTHNDAIVKSTDFQRLNSRFNVDAKLTNYLDLMFNLGFTRIERSLLDDGIDDYSSPTWQSQIKSTFFSPFDFTDAGNKNKSLAYADEFGVANPTGIIDFAQNRIKKYRFNVSAAPSLTIIPGLVFSTHFDYNINKSIEAYFLPVDYSPSRYLPNKGISRNMLSSQTLRNIRIFEDSRLSYTKSFGLHNLNAMYGFRYLKNLLESDYVEEHNSGSNKNTQITGNYSFKETDGMNNITKSITNYASVDYDYNKKYFLTAAMALEASSRFGKNTEGGVSLFGESWAVFPSVNGAWLFSSEKFMRPAKFLNFGKLRLGYGVTGNDGIQDYQTMMYLSSIRFAAQANGLIISNLENDKIQWETTKRANAGIDLGLFQDRLSISFDVFQSKTDDLLVLKDLPDVSGLSQYWSNGGSLENKGYELSAGVKVVNLRDFKWELGASMGHYKNKIKSLIDEGGYYTTNVYGGEVITRVGDPTGLFWGYKTKGVFSTGEEARNADLKILDASGRDIHFEAGDIWFEDLNNDGYIDEKDKQVIGDPNPDFYGTITSKWGYKRFTLDAIFTYSYGNDVYNYYRSQLESGSGFNNQTTAMNNRWTAEGQATSIPKSTYGDPMGNARFSDRWIEDGSYFRLKTLKLSYEVPIRNEYIRGLNIWASASNLFTITKYLGSDPEFYSGNSVYYQGVDAGLLPLTRSYYIGVKINL